jgi:hypothetical protein
MITEPITIQLSQAEALVLLEFLSRYSDAGKLEIEDQAEQRALWDLGASLEKVLVEPFMPNYRELLEIARRQIRDEN